MQRPGYLPFADVRWTPFIRTLSFRGIDLTGATLRAQVRSTRDVVASPLVDLQTVGSANTEGLRLLSAGLVDGVMTSVIYMRINEATMEGLPAAAEPGDDLRLWWDMHITPAGGVKQRYLWGEFILLAGVTQ
jgi:hypothetical protein